MRTSGNPAFRKLPAGVGGGGYAGFNAAQAGAMRSQPGYQQAPPTAGERPMTVDDVVLKTAASLGVAFATGIATAIAVLSGSLSPYPPMIIGMLVGLGLSLYIIFKQKPSAALTLTYSAAEGVFLGAITGVFEALTPNTGIALQAILGTGLVFVVMLVLYKTGAVKVTPKLTKWIIGATVGAALLLLVNLLVSGFGGGSMFNGGPLGIGISLLLIGIAAFNLLLDFDMADTMIREGMPSKWAWFAAFGLMTTLVWLYLEMLRLLWQLNSE
ncbi:putative YccA/Bax inhibitor family protein [Herbihabitans rhizosphaerae]|uniref:Putative YccA/Bax inhibitor family protein n=1 Tax=Herbihabitans rhizosphaerae TaxID=1872711 RepID=A0A4Q7KN01_9PSEU|nr:Bax inhibitor-1/YccA family protein [Herbihabitans rhizosphaerae]RZS36991.1 putative YccA/Bax inhibitor family protein [Herbihabitans rhizosphaerae]